MTIVLNRLQIGVVGVTPSIVFLSTADDYSTIITAGYLDSASEVSGVAIEPTDILMASYDNGSSFGIFTPSISSGVITLVPYQAPSGSIDTANLADEAVTTAKLDDAAVTTAKIADGDVTLAKLDAGITPSHITVYSDRITWSGGGASLTTAVSGVLATDQIVATIRTKPTQAAYLARASTNTDQVILELSAANTSNDAVITYNVLRAAS